LLVTQLVQSSLLLEQSLSLGEEALAALPILSIPVGTLLLLLLPVTLTPVVVAITIVTSIPVSIPVAIVLLLLSLLLPTPLTLL